MRRKLLLKDHKVESIMTDFSNLEDEQTIAVSTRIRIGIAENDNYNCLVEISPEYRNIKTGDSVVFSVKCIVFFELTDDVTQAEKLEIIREDGVQEAYNLTRNKVNEIIKLSNIDFPSMPDYSTVKN
ncbi:MAG: hypothetical protein J1F11_06305 [Oscillospiraceae bacterium]|nr:hypothetical protein [Oscillospiraceae bacterium]